MMVYRRTVLADVAADPLISAEVARQAQRRDLEAVHFFICDKCGHTWLPNFDAAPHVILGIATPAELTEAIELALDGWTSMYLLGCGFPLATLCRACARLPDDDLLASSVGALILERFVPAESL